MYLAKRTCCRGLVEAGSVHGFAPAAPMQAVPAHVAVQFDVVLIKRYKQRDVGRLLRRLWFAASATR